MIFKCSWDFYEVATKMTYEKTKMFLNCFQNMAPKHLKTGFIAWKAVLKASLEEDTIIQAMTGYGFRILWHRPTWYLL